VSTSQLAIVAAALVASYLLGSIPFGLLLARWARGIDLRQHGSGNIGATNVARTMGLKWGLVVLLLDALKGLIPVLVLSGVAVPKEHWAFHHVRVGCGVAAVMGHMYPCWLQFRGGKGVATALGVVCLLAPWASLGAFAAFTLTLACSRIVSLSSMAAALAFAIVEQFRLWPSAFSGENWSMGLFSLAVPALILVRHRENIGRLWRGEEQRFRFRRADAGAAPDAIGQARRPGSPTHREPAG
jgi:glycerol-3-phosphate acyltransferase PlsY